MATKHRSHNVARPDHPPKPNTFRYLMQAICLICLAALSSPLSQLKLAPVYGSIPSSQFHHIGSALLALLALTRRSLVARWIPLRVPVYLQVLACWIPTLQFLLIKFSTQLGPTNGPLLTEALTYYPLLFFTAYTASGLLQSAQIDRYVHRSFGDTVLGLAAYGTFTICEGLAWPLLVWTSSLSQHLTRTAIQLIVGGVYSAISPSKMHIATIAPLLLTMIIDPHTTSPSATRLLQSSLQLQNWTLLDRGDSITGYVSVLENQSMQYRVLRCDHSLLGGEWQVTDQRKKDGIVVPEPIYAVFEMLEAVRLVQTPSSTKPDSTKNA